MAVAMATRHRWMKMWAMKHLGSGHQYNLLQLMVAIDTGNRQQVVDDIMPCISVHLLQNLGNYHRNACVSALGHSKEDTLVKLHTA